MFAVDRVQSTTGSKIYHVIRLDGLRILVALDNPKNTSGRFSGATDNSTPPIGTTGLFFEGDIGPWELSKNSKNLSYSVEFEKFGWLQHLRQLFGTHKGILNSDISNLLSALGTQPGAFLYKILPPCIDPSKKIRKCDYLLK